MLAFCPLVYDIVVFFAKAIRSDKEVALRFEVNRYRTFCRTQVWENQVRSSLRLLKYENMARRTNASRCSILIRILGCTPSSTRFTRREDICPSTFSDPALRFLKGQLRSCFQSHRECISDGSYMPEFWLVRVSVPLSRLYGKSGQPRAAKLRIIRN
jgi:hypothetical protein